MKCRERRSFGLNESRFDPYITSCGGLRLVRAFRNSDDDIGGVRRPHGVQVSPEDVNLGHSRSRFQRLGVPPSRKGRRFGGTAGLNSKDLRLFLVQRVSQGPRAFSVRHGGARYSENGTRPI